jgi:putative heme transporter
MEAEDVNPSSPVVTPTSTEASASATGGWQRHWKRWILIAAALVALVVFHKYRSLLFTSIGELGHLQWGAVAAGVACEIGSMTSYARMQRRILRSGGLRLTVESMVAITYAGNAIAVTLPLAGSGLGTVFVHRQFSTRGADASVATWALVLSGIFSTVAFALVISVGAVVSGNLPAEIAGIAGTALVVLPLVALRIAARHPATRTQLMATATRA